MKLAKTTFTLLKIVIIVVISFLLVYTTIAQENKSSYSSSLLIGSGLFFADKTPISNSFILGIGLNQKKAISVNWYSQISIRYAYSNIGDYKNKISFITNWDQGPQTTEVRLSTKIQQHMISLPISLTRQWNKFGLGVGAGIRCVIKATYSQKPVGKYHVDGYADGEEDVFTSRVNRVFAVNENTDALQINLLNIFTSLSLEYKLSNNLGAEFYGCYFPIRENQFSTKFSSFNSSEIIFLINYKFH